MSWRNTAREDRRAALPPGVEAGCRVELEMMGADPCPVEPGSRGTVTLIDGGCTVHVRWDNGRLLGLVPGVDRFRVLPAEGGTHAAEG